jgi:hypothetical protein
MRQSTQRELSAGTGAKRELADVEYNLSETLDRLLSCTTEIQRALVQLRGMYPGTRNLASNISSRKQPWTYEAMHGPQIFHTSPRPPYSLEGRPSDMGKRGVIAAAGFSVALWALLVGVAWLAT